MTLTIPFTNTYATLPDGAYTRMAPTPVTAPRLIRLNTPLAARLGIEIDDMDHAAAVFGGNEIPAGADPLAQVYAGHQFGGFSPRLGDGRALLLGDITAPDSAQYDIALKGSGPTPYSRNGDGRAWLGPVLREYVVSESMAALGIPTTRALAIVQTGENIQRETVLPGAVLTRIAASHIRVGTFQYFAARKDIPALKALFEYTIARHYPDAITPQDLLKSVIARQSELVAKWESVGFIHGVMNTDNTTLSGETIDYGPCAFMDTYHPQTVYSSIDRNGRYAYDNQRHVIVWNMAQLATSLLALFENPVDHVDEFTEIVHAMPGQIDVHWRAFMGRKIGLENAGADDVALIQSLLDLMANQQADFTNTFRALPTGNARDQFTDPTGFDTWQTDWQTRLASEGSTRETNARINAANPAYIPRNHRIESMIQSALADDFAPFERLLNTLAHPFSDQPGAADLARPPTHDERVEHTFCGT